MLSMNYVPRLPDEQESYMFYHYVRINLLNNLSPCLRDVCINDVDYLKSIVYNNETEPNYPQRIIELVSDIFVTEKSGH